MIKRSTSDIWVGLLFLLAIGCMLFLALKVVAPGVAASDSYVVYAEFENVGNLKVQAPVRAAGVLVGRVSAIELNRENHLAEVRINLDRSYQFSRDVGAEILTSGVLGEQYVGLSQGADRESLQEGETILQTSSALVLEQMISKFLLNSVENMAGN